ncbi:hypothetical protein HDU76_013398 [Blyttiomyces sp. JEL0837]|nr:hypothetical protein HDU76_013398 [Blyttiomyces sp. JEL0837]
MKKIVVLISGNGSNLQSIINATKSGALPVEIALVVSNKSTAFGLTRANEAKIPTLTMTLKSFKDQGKTREDYDIALAAKIVETFQSVTGSQQFPDLVVLAGWMHILSATFLEKFPAGLFINLHPALPGAFDGANAISRAHQAFQEGTITKTGVMVHRVTPVVDHGEVLAVQEVAISADDTLESLEERMHQVEHGLIITGIKAALGV